MDTVFRNTFGSTRQKALDELYALHDASNTSVQYQLLTEQSCTLSSKFNDHLSMVLSLANKELRERFLQDIEDILLDKANNNADQFGLAYTTTEGTMTRCADINKDLAMITPDLLATITFVVLCAPPAASPSA